VNTSKITRSVILVCLLALCGWDVFVAWNGVPGDTVSEMVFNFARHHPTIPFLLGYVCGHFFWGQNETFKDETKEELNDGI